MMIRSSTSWWLKESGEECLKEMNKNPDLVILDYLFYGDNHQFMNGLEVFNRIKELKPHTPVIILSGQDKGEIVLELARKGIEDYIIKDNNLIDNLEVAIKEVFERKS
jgi:DNA-binding NarL/FixJ family response regulator